MKEKIFLMSPLKVVANHKKTTASNEISASQPQQDCLYMKSVLVSTGQNKNDDVFLPEEMWKARSSPEKKPVNWEHNTGYEIVDSPEGDGKRVVADNQIIGVMDSSYPAHKDGTPINTEAAIAEDFEIPQDFDIVTEAVIWKYLFPKTAAKLINEAGANRMFVSMEAWFNSFDYRVGSKIIARNEQTAFLDRHLRSNGGDGNFEGQKVGRVLRNITFGGVGIVANPANEDSVINSFTNADLNEASAVINSTIASNTIGHLSPKFLKEPQEVCDNMANVNEPNTSANTQVNITSEDYKEVVKRLVKAEHTIETKDTELAEAKAEIEKMKQNTDSTKSAFAKGSDALAKVLGDTAAHKISKAGAENFFQALVEEITEKLGQNDAVSAELSEVKTKLDELENERRLASRLDKIRAELGLGSDDKERLDALATSTDSLDDESFASWLENTKELFISAKKDKKMDESKDKDKEDKDKKKNPFAKSASDDGVTDVRILDNVTATAGAPAGVDDAAQVVPLTETMKTLASALWGINKRDNSKGGE